MAIINSPFDLPEGRLIALDLGQVRIGVAVSDPTGTLSRPLGIVQRRATRSEDFAALRAVVQENGAVGVLVGMPASDGESNGSQARWVRRYAGRLAGALAVPVAYWDETLSSVEAGRLLAESGSRTGLDSAAAALILADFFDARRLRSS